jgi:diphthine synthase
MKEPDYDELLKGRVKYLPPRFMSINTAIRQMFEVEHKLKGTVLRSGRQPPPPPC